MKENLNEHFCLSTFNSVSISPRGIVRPCCWQSDPVMHTGQPNVKKLEEEIKWPTQYITALQQVMLSNDNIPEKTPNCSGCWNGEKNINWSHRKNYNHRWLEGVNKLSDQELQEVIANPKIATVDVQFGYLCNNSCVMCSPAHSSHFHSTHIKLAEHTSTKEQKDFYKSRFYFLDEHKQDWTADPESFEKVKNLCEDALEISISGGEPMMNPMLKTFLEFIVSKKVPLRHMLFTTNGTIYDQEIVDLLNKIPSLTFKISLESIGAQEEFLRWPTKWEEKDAVIKKFLQNIKNQKNKFLFSSVVQSLNIFDLVDVKNYVRSLDTTKNTEYQLQVTKSDQVSSLWNTSNDYLDYYLNEFPDDKKMPQVTQHIKIVRNSTNRNITRQVRFYQDLIDLQKKNFEDIFPIYYKYHKNYFNK